MSGSENWRRTLERRNSELEDEVERLRDEGFKTVEEVDDEQLEAELAKRRGVAAHQRIDDAISGAETAVSGPQDAIAQMKAIPLLNSDGSGWNPMARQALRELIHRNGGAVLSDDPGRWLKGGHLAEPKEFAVTKPER